MKPWRYMSPSGRYRAAGAGTFVVSWFGHDGDSDHGWSFCFGKVDVRIRLRPNYHGGWVFRIKPRWWPL